VRATSGRNLGVVAEPLGNLRVRKTYDFLNTPFAIVHLCGPLFSIQVDEKSLYTGQCSG